MGDSDQDSADESESGKSGPAGPGETAGGSDPVRREAERLVAAALGAVRLSLAGVGAAGAGDPHTAGAAGTGAESGTGATVTGATDCAFCPFCRAVKALRDPSPEFADRLATAAGDLATGLTSLLRVFSTAAAGNRGSGGVRTAPPDVGRTTVDEVWREATRTGHDSWPVPERDVPATATDAETDARPAGAVPPADAAGCARVPQPSVPPEPAGPEPAAGPAVRRRAPASPAGRPLAGAADDDPGRRD